MLLSHVLQHVSVLATSSVVRSVVRNGQVRSAKAASDALHLPVKNWNVRANGGRAEVH
jgi:hypothetical protein